MSDETWEIEFETDLEDQYIAVLLEMYFTEEEFRDYGPIGRRRINYWKQVVRTFEQLFPPAGVKQAQRQARRAEKLGLNAFQRALVRYAWVKQAEGTASPREVVRRWLDYLAPGIRLRERFVSYPEFREARRFREYLRGVEDAGLWPWSATVPQATGRVERFRTLADL
ncbi:MAG: hypothetical protein Kow00109_03480 [Acidobacteriota bacterium]